MQATLIAKQATLIAKQFELNHKVAHVNLDGISHEDSLRHPAPAGNCLNWVAGHVVATRNFLMDLLDESPVWRDDQAAPYARGSKPPLAAEKATTLEDIIASLDRSQAALTARLATLSDDELSRTREFTGPAREPLTAFNCQTLGEALTLFGFHEAYHVGQFGLLRRLIGKGGAIA